MKTISAFDKKSSIGRRAQLVRLARSAQINFDGAIALYQDRVCALRPSRTCIAEAAASLRHHQARYEQLVAALATAAGLSTASVENDLSGAWPVVPRLLNLEGGAR